MFARAGTNTHPNTVPDAAKNGMHVFAFAQFLLAAPSHTVKPYGLGSEVSLVRFTPV